ncbi:hypothetical protein IG605_001305 [Pectobacterium quasiaquaticum]|uniref:hypothetical protein n=1 Tax=Pectobacterium quasiaquaticum TaxID=2774015 RepID=UPI0018773747|nr:hypothetical protein [Pectobacterium quasiaquaticum]URG53044.1 hypothetical protein IG605_001305 [Pectobacterium quasiaquaticum]
MNREMKAALDAALIEILAMSPDEFLKEASDSMSGDVCNMLLQSRKFESFDIKALEPLQLNMAEAMPKYLVTMFSNVKMHNSVSANQVLDTETFALAA